MGSHIVTAKGRATWQPPGGAEGLATPDPHGASPMLSLGLGTVWLGRGPSSMAVAHGTAGPPIINVIGVDDHYRVARYRREVGSRRLATPASSVGWPASRPRSDPRGERRGRRWTVGRQRPRWLWRHAWRNHGVAPARSHRRGLLSLARFFMCLSPERGWRACGVLVGAPAGVAGKSGAGPDEGRRAILRRRRCQRRIASVGMWFRIGDGGPGARAPNPV